MDYDMHTDGSNDSKGMIISAVMHALLFLIFFVITFTHLDPPPQADGAIVIDFATTDVDEITEDQSVPDNAQAQAAEAAPNNPEKTTNAPIASAAVKSASNTPISKTTEEKSDVLASQAKAKKANEDAAKAKKDADAKAALEAKQKAEEEARIKAQYEANKKKYSDLLGKGSNSKGSGTGEADSNNPNASSLEGLSKGNGQVGEGLSGRKLLKEPKITDNSQKAGKVVVKVCVDKTGKVIEAKYTQKGSTTTDAHLVKVAEEGAKKYQFAASDLDKQCGSITIDFILE